MTDGRPVIPLTGPIFPLATLDDLHAELADTERSLARLGERRVVDADQMNARRLRLEWWRDRIQSQIDEMEGARCSRTS